MTQLIRRPPRVHPPTRGRAAAFTQAEQSRLTPLTVFRQGPPSAGPIREKVVYRPEPPEIHPVLIKLYKLSPYLFQVLDQPWKWFLALTVLLLLAVSLGTLL